MDESRNSRPLTLADGEELVSQIVLDTAALVRFVSDYGPIIKTLPDMAQKIELVLTNLNLSLQIQGTTARAAESIGETLKEFKDVFAGELRQSYQTSGSKVDKSVVIMFFMMLLTIVAMYMGYNFTNKIFDAKKPLQESLDKIVEKQDESINTLIESRKAADIRAEAQKKALIDAAQKVDDRDKKAR